MAGIWFTTLPRLAEQLAAPRSPAQAAAPPPARHHRRDPRVPRRQARRLRRGGRAPGDGPRSRPRHHALRDVDADRAQRARRPRPAPPTSSACTARPPAPSGGWYDTTDLLDTATRLVGTSVAGTDELGPARALPPAGPGRAETPSRALAGRPRPHVVAGSPACAADRRARRRSAAERRAAVAPPRGGGAPTATRVLTASDADDEVRCVVREVVAALRDDAGAPGRRALRRRIALRPAAARAPRRRRHHGQRPGRATGRRARAARLVLGLLELARTGFRRGRRAPGPRRGATDDLRRAAHQRSRWERVSREAGVVGRRRTGSRLAPTSSAQETGGRRGRSTSRAASSAPTANREAAEPLRDFVAELQRPVRGAARPGHLAGAGPVGARPVPRPRRRRTATSASRSRSSTPPASSSGRCRAWPPSTPGPAPADLPARGGPRGRAGVGPPPRRPVRRGRARRPHHARHRARPRRRLRRRASPRTSSPAGSTTTPSCPSVSARRMRSASCPPPGPRLRPRAPQPAGRLRLGRPRHGELPARRPPAAYASAAQPLAAAHAAPPERQPRPRGHGVGEGHRARPATGCTARLVSPASLLATDRAQQRAGVAHAAASGGTARSTTRSSTPRASMRRAGSRPSSRASTATSPAPDGLPDFARRRATSSPRPRWSTTRSARTSTSSSACSASRPSRSPRRPSRSARSTSATSCTRASTRSSREAARAASCPTTASRGPTPSAQRLPEIGATPRPTSTRPRAAPATPCCGSDSARASSAVLDWMLDDDNRWRAEQDAAVVASELPFGLKGEPSRWSSPLGRAAHVRFRGAADKVDQRRDGTLLVTDIKTGSAAQVQGPVGGRPGRRRREAPAARLRPSRRARRHGDPDTPVEALYWFVRKRPRRASRCRSPTRSTARMPRPCGLLVDRIARGAFPQRRPRTPTSSGCSARSATPTASATATSAAVGSASG